MLLAQRRIDRDRREPLGLGAFVALSVALHLGAAVLLAGSERIAIVDPVALASAPRPVRVSLVRAARAAPAPAPPAVAPVPAPSEPRHTPAPTPPALRTQDPVPPSPPLPGSEPQPRPEPAEARSAASIEQVAAAEPAVEPTEPEPPPAAAANAASIAAVDRTSESEDHLALYVAQVRAMIVAQKRYPALARRRSIEGAVDARIEIDAEGSLKGVRLSASAPRVLSRATEQAIRRAAPFPSPPEGVRVIEIPVDYSLLDAS